MKTICCRIPSLVCDGGWWFFCFGLPPPVTRTKYLETEFLKPGRGFIVKVNVVKLMEEYYFVTMFLQFISVLLLNKLHGKLSGNDCAESIGFLFFFILSFSLDWFHLCHQPNMQLGLYTYKTLHVFIQAHFIITVCRQALPVGT